MTYTCVFPKWLKLNFNCFSPFPVFAVIVLARTVFHVLIPTCALSTTDRFYAQMALSNL